MKRRSAAVVLCLAVFGLAALAQDLAVRDGVEQVRVEVWVTDGRQNPVTDLQLSDFEIDDDGQPQKLVTFVPPGQLPATPPTPLSPAGASAAPTSGLIAPAAPGRPVVIVLDDLHIAAANTLKVADAVHRFIETVVPPSDSLAVVFTGGAPGGGQDFTTDRRLVSRAIDRFRGQKLRSATVERMNDPILNRSGRIQPNADVNKPERANRARIALETLQKIADALAPFGDRRPMVLWVSEGPEYEVTDRPDANESNQWSISRSMRAAIERLNRVNAVTYAIDPRGVSAGNADQIQTSTIFEMYRSIGSSALRNEEIRAFGLVQAVASNTGGFAMLWRPNMSADFKRVAAASQSYYVIGYDAPSTDRGAYHSIVVRVKRSKVQVRARTGYFLPGR